MSTAADTPHRSAPQPDLGPICRLADHLDAALAMGEDLLRLTLDADPLGTGATAPTITERQNAIAAFARSARALELAMTARILQARRRAVELRAVHPRFTPLLGLFIGGTAPLADAAAGLCGGLGDISTTALADGSDVLDFLCSRMLVEPEARTLAGVGSIMITEDCLVAGRIHLGTLMDMIAQIAETLDLAFDLYAEPRPRAQPAG